MYSFRNTNRFMIIMILLSMLIFPISGIKADSLYTPNGSLVDASDEYDTHDPDEVYDWTEWAYDNYSSFIIALVDSAKGEFNCHGYAWAGYEDISHYIDSDDTTDWKWDDSENYFVIGLLPNLEDDEDIYWLDGSYRQTDEDHATHANYSSDEHSVLMTGDKLGGDHIVVSKWGLNGPTIMHKIGYDPWGTGDPKFYARFPSLFSPWFED